MRYFRILLQKTCVWKSTQLLWKTFLKKADYPSQWLSTSLNSPCHPNTQKIIADRHIYDLYRMSQPDIAAKSIIDNEHYESIKHWLTIIISNELRLVIVKGKGIERCAVGVWDREKEVRNEDEGWRWGDMKKDGRWRPSLCC